MGIEVTEYTLIIKETKHRVVQLSDTSDVCSLQRGEKTMELRILKGIKKVTFDDLTAEAIIYFEDSTFLKAAFVYSSEEWS